LKEFQHGVLPSGAYGKRGPAHNTNSHFAPTYRKVVNLPGLLKTKRLNEWWKTKLKGTSNKRELKRLEV